MGVHWSAATFYGFPVEKEVDFFEEWLYEKLGDEKDWFRENFGWCEAGDMLAGQGTDKFIVVGDTYESVDGYNMVSEVDRHIPFTHHEITEHLCDILNIPYKNPNWYITLTVS